MSRFMALALCFVLPTAAHAASLKDFELSKMLEKVAKESSVGTPRAINEDILDQGYTGRRQPVDQSPQRTRQPRRAHALQPGQRAQPARR